MNGINGFVSLIGLAYLKKLFAPYRTNHSFIPASPISHTNASSNSNHNPMPIPPSLSLPWSNHFGYQALQSLALFKGRICHLSFPPPLVWNIINENGLHLGEKVESNGFISCGQPTRDGQEFFNLCPREIYKRSSKSGMKASRSFSFMLKKNKLESPPHLLVQNPSIKNTILLGVGSCIYLSHQLLIREPWHNRYTPQKHDAFWHFLSLLFGMICCGACSHATEIGASIPMLFE